MAYRRDSDVAREPLRTPSNSTHQNPQLGFRISNPSDVPDFVTYGYEPYHANALNTHQQATEQTTITSNIELTNRTSRDRHENETQDQNPTPWRGSFPYIPNRGYTPVAVGGSTSLRTDLNPGRRTSFTSVLKRQSREGDDGEAHDMSLISGAAPISGSGSDYTAIPEDYVPTQTFDLSTFQGPTGLQDEGFLRSLQEQEANGKLTLGLGQGFRPEKIRDKDLIIPPVTERSVSRSFSKSVVSKPLGREESIRVAGQDEANRRGEVIEIIQEDTGAPGTDLSTIEGPRGIGSADPRRQSAAVLSKQPPQIFYPQPNWKPFTMRWPYLSILIILSAALSIMQEILYQKYHGSNPLLSFQTPDKIEAGLYFLFKFGPTLVAVIYGVLWQFTDFEVRRLEAYYQMSKDGGALAAESINVDYVTSFAFLRPLSALRVGHFAVALSSLGTMFAVSFVPTFAAASLVLTPNRQQRLAHPDVLKQVFFSPIWSRLASITLLINAFVACGLFYLLQTRRSGLVADVRGIAGLASMAVVSHILMDFKDMDTATPKDIHHKLKNHRYILRNCSLAPDHENPPTNMERDKYRDIRISSNPHPLMLRPIGSIPFIIALLLFMGFIPTFLFSKAAVVTDKAPWVVTAMAVGLKLSWGALETAVRMMEPFYILSKRHAPSKTLTLDYTALPFGHVALRAFSNGHELMFLVAVGTFMTEWLTVLVTGLATVAGGEFLPKDKPPHTEPDDDNRMGSSGQETISSFYISLTITMVILLYMTVVASLVFIRRRHPFLPRQPNTIASILAFIHQSKMLYNFVGTSKLSSRDMVNKLDDGGVTKYGLGWFIGRDGQMHCGVDQEELVSHYKHGVDDSQRNEPWNTRWDQL